MKKIFFLLINLLAAVTAIVLLSIIKIRFPEGDLAGIINSPVYEETDDYYSLINERLNDIFTLISYKIPFEHNGVLSYDKIIAESLDKNGTIIKWNLKNCLDLSVKYGFYIDSEYHMNRLVDNTIPKFEKDDILNFMFKTYPSKQRVGASSKEDFLTEIVNALADYYKATNHLDNTKSNFSYKILFTNNETNDIVEYNNTDMTTEDFLNTPAFIYLSTKDGIISSNITNLNKDLLKRLKKINPYPDKDFALYCSIDLNFSKNDKFKTEYNKYNAKKTECGKLTISAIIATSFFVISLFAILFCIFASTKNVESSPVFFNAIPTDFYILAYIFFTIAGCFFINRLITSKVFSSKDLSGIKMYAYPLVLYITTIILFSILSYKYSNNTLEFELFKLKKKADDITSPTLPLAATLTIMLIPTIIFAFISFSLIYLYTLTADKKLLITGIVMFISTICFIIYLLLLHNSFKKALEAQTKSNNMRTSLIANVSHDIKTPLTSIINYTGLITEEITKPSKGFKKNLLHYSDVVTDKANRLNDLINELIFESKVSTGNINLEFEPLELVSFIEQINTEFKDKLNDCNLKTIYSHNVNKIMIKVDSKQLYRVFQNLFSNICKYALEKSRIYIDLEATKNRVTVTIKNIQKEKIEVDVDTLKERFVRGTKSRTTEGFGLGLSISENLIKSMGGKLDIKNIRDEFITIIKFITINE